jgi:hypothetical protein
MATEMGLSSLIALLVAGVLPLRSGADTAPVLPIFDAHIHYNEDIWEAIPPREALDRLTRAGITRAVVSSTPTEGVERLYRLSPERIVPFLRPYPTRAHRRMWFRDAQIPDWVRARLARMPYRGIGEFHVFSERAKTPVVREIIRLARQRRLCLHAHTDLAGMEAILEQAPDIAVIWAHAGFDVPLLTLRGLLDGHPQLYLELSFREGIIQDG